MNRIRRASARVRRISSVLRHDESNSTIEFAILAPFVFVIVLSTVEMALDMMIDATVQIAAQAASRTGLTTTNPSARTRTPPSRSSTTFSAVGPTSARP